MDRGRAESLTDDAILTLNKATALLSALNALVDRSGPCCLPYPERRVEIQIEGFESVAKQYRTNIGKLCDAITKRQQDRIDKEVDHHLGRLGIKSTT